MTEVKENANNTQLWHQSVAYDRYGNRTINAGGTSVAVNHQSFEVETLTNRLLASGDSALTGQNLPQRKMRYDPAGNLVNDNWSSYGSSTAGEITRTYDAENRMTSAWDSSGGISYHTYNADGQRVRRKLGGVETWQVYGMDGELLAEYAASVTATPPQKEYGYRNGQLLITAEPGSGSLAPVFADDFNDNSLDANRWTVIYPGSSPVVTEQSQQLQITLAPNTAGYNGVDSLSTYDLTGRMVQVEVAQAVSQAGSVENFLELDLDANNCFLIDAVASSFILRSRVNGINDQTVLTYSASTHRHWRIRHDQSANTINFETSSDGTAWTTRKTVTPGFSLTSMRLRMGAGAWGTGNGSPGAAKYDNFKLLASTQTNTALSVPNSSFETPSVGAGSFQYSPSGGSWTFAGGAGVTGNNSGFTGGVAAPDGVQAAFLQGGNTSIISQTISGFQAGTNYTLSFSAIQRLNCCNSGGQDFEVYLDSQLLGTFHPSTAGYIDYSTAVFTTSAGSHVVKFVGLNLLGGDHTAFIDNVRVTGSPVPGLGINWLVTDQLGTPRLIFDKSGTLANTKRHDYLPFGEELSTQGSRTSLLGYSADAVRQKFTSYERDSETGLDFAQARYYSSRQGRFTSADEPFADQSPDDPQSWNMYSYVRNNPLRSIDREGRKATWANMAERLNNLFWYGYSVSNVEILLMAEERREWLNKYYYEKDEQGNWRPFDASKLDTQEVFDKVREVQYFAEQKQLHNLTDDEVLEAYKMSPIVGTGTRGPSGEQSTEKYLERNWDKSNFGSIKKSIEYHLEKHGGGMSEVEYTQRAVKAFNDSGAVRSPGLDKLGRAAVRIVSKEGVGLFTKAGKIIWFQPK